MLWMVYLPSFYLIWFSRYYFLPCSLRFIYFYLICICFFLACMCTTCITEAHVDQMRALDALEVEFQMVVSSLNLGLLSRAAEPSFQPHILHLSYCLFMPSCFFTLADLFKSGSILLNFRKKPLGSLIFSVPMLSLLLYNQCSSIAYFFLHCHDTSTQNIIHKYKGCCLGLGVEHQGDWKGNLFHSLLDVSRVTIRQLGKWGGL